MSIEATIYAPTPSTSVSQLIEVGHGAGLELRAFDPDDPTYRPVPAPGVPLENAWYVVIGWPRPDTETTREVDLAMGRGDKAAVDQLGMDGRLGWFELSCERIDYEQSWEDCPDEREEVEQSYSPEELERMRGAETKYLLRCGTRPPQNGSLLCKVAELIVSVTGGFLDVP